MQYQSFVIQIANPTKTQTELNSFLRAHKIITVNKEFVQSGENSFWALLIEYMDFNSTHSEKSPVDYRSVLSQEDFELFSQLREERKKLAEQAGLPVYAVVNNAHLAQIAMQKPKTPSELMKIDGIGKGKCEKFGLALVQVVQTYEESR